MTEGVGKAGHAKPPPGFRSRLAPLARRWSAGMAPAPQNQKKPSGRVS
ncbi:hypothetical protein L665_00892 [Ralstonia solanacearum SD54]|nr:hypothetical protein F504_3150 [Ralstonia pseudosolanacearum FQY_4]ESS50532.1 hypothetical protein L665_00892 [Ralstonia solanacearum SD54]